MDEADYLVLGGGSAGCVLASRLSEDPSATVALIEAGGSGDSWVVETPIAGVLMAPTKLNNWAYETVPQPGLGGRRGYQPRGRALGGSSAINAMIYTRGHPADYDAWAALGNPGWSYAETLPYFLKAENNEAFHDAFHGRGGPLNVADPRTDNPFQQRFLDAAREAQFPLNDDFNGARQEGSASIRSPRSTASAAARRAPICGRISASGPICGSRPARARYGCCSTASARSAPKSFSAASSGHCGRGARPSSRSAPSARRNSSCCRASATRRRLARSASRR